MTGISKTWQQQTPQVCRRLDSARLDKNNRHITCVDNWKQQDLMTTTGTSNVLGRKGKGHIVTRQVYWAYGAAYPVTWGQLQILVYSIVATTLALKFVATTLAQTIVATTLAYSNGKCSICSEHSHTPFTLALQQLSQPFGLPQTSVLTFYMACLPGVGRLAFMQPTRRMSVVSAITYFCWRSKISLPTFDSWGMLVIVVPSLWDCTMSVTICVLPTSLMLAGDRRRRVWPCKDKWTN